MRYALDPKNVYTYYNSDREPIFEENIALAILLVNDVLILNNHWWKADWPLHAQQTFTIAVNCNDIFLPGADAEELIYDELEELWQFYAVEQNWGPQMWVAKKRQKLPFPLFEKKIRQLNIEQFTTILDEIKNGIIR